MNERDNFEDLNQIREDFNKFYNKIKSDIKDYHNNSWKNFFKDFGVCGLSSVSLATPLYASLEAVLPKLVNSLPEVYQYFPDMGVDDSLSLRLWLALPIMFSGYVSDKLRTKNRKKIKNGSVAHHDGSFGSKLNFATNIVPYGVKFNGDLFKAGVLTIGSIPISYASGMAEGFTTDFMKHSILNEKPTERIPGFLKNASRKTKLGLTGLMVATSIGLTYGVYTYSDYLESIQGEKKEEKINNLEMKTLEKVYPEFDRDSIGNYSVPADGVRVDSQKRFQN